MIAVIVWIASLGNRSAVATHKPVNRYESLSRHQIPVRNDGDFLLPPMKVNIMRQVSIAGQIANRSANRLYEQKLKPFFDEIKQKDAKEVFASTLMLRASAELFHLLGPNYEDHVDNLVFIMKEQAKAARETSV